jgi:hypothetical protein
MTPFNGMGKLINNTVSDIKEEKYQKKSNGPMIKNY